MSTKFELVGITRTDKKINSIRKTGNIPAVIYGDRHEISQNVFLEIPKKSLEKVLHEAGKHTLIDLSVDGKKYAVIIKDIQRHPIRENILHVDFFCVNMMNEVKVLVPLSFVGEAPVQKKYGGIVVHHVNALKIVCLPGNIPDSIPVDISSLKELSDMLKVSDVIALPKIKILEDPRRLIINIAIIKKAVVVPKADADAKGSKKGAKK
ncbi:MAG: 50S ribosomal protein L25 [Candidatus Falkowbacteria bacterium]|nr:50S ribosomal protein L25 [Candidatus Falkowbacteria bacterium]